MQTLEQTTITVGGVDYLVTAFPATMGLDILGKLTTVTGTPPAEFMKFVILKAVKVNNKMPTEDWFNKKFSRNYKELYELFSKITEYNFGDLSGEGDEGNGDEDTSEQD